MRRATSRILVVDDDPDLRRVVVELLQAHGYEVLEAASGGEGVELARGAQPQLILMDFHLPELGGAETIGALRQDPATRKIPVAALTGATNVDADQLVKAGFVGHIPKPIDVPSFATLIAGFLSTAESRA